MASDLRIFFKEANKLGHVKLVEPNSTKKDEIYKRTASKGIEVNHGLLTMKADLLYYLACNKNVDITVSNNLGIIIKEKDQEEERPRSLFKILSPKVPGQYSLDINGGHGVLTLHVNVIPKTKTTDPDPATPNNNLAALQLATEPIHATSAETKKYVNKTLIIPGNHLAVVQLVREILLGKQLTEHFDSDGQSLWRGRGEDNLYEWRVMLLPYSEEEKHLKIAAINKLQLTRDIFLLIQAPVEDIVHFKRITDRELGEELTLRPLMATEYDIDVEHLCPALQEIVTALIHRKSKIIARSALIPAVNIKRIDRHIKAWLADVTNALVKEDKIYLCFKFDTPPPRTNNNMNIMNLVGGPQQHQHPLGHFPYNNVTNNNDHTYWDESGQFGNQLNFNNLQDLVNINNTNAVSTNTNEYRFEAFKFDEQIEDLFDNDIALALQNSFETYAPSASYETVGSGSVLIFVSGDRTLLQTVDSNKDRMRTALAAKNITLRRVYQMCLSDLHEVMRDPRNKARQSALFDLYRRMTAHGVPLTMDEHDRGINVQFFDPIVILVRSESDQKFKRLKIQGRSITEITEAIKNKFNTHSVQLMYRSVNDSKSDLRSDEDMHSLTENSLIIYK